MRRSGEEANAAVADDDDNGNQDEVNMFEFIILILVELAGKSNRDILHFSGHGGGQEGDGNGEYFFLRV